MVTFQYAGIEPDRLVIRTARSHLNYLRIRWMSSGCSNLLMFNLPIHSRTSPPVTSIRVRSSESLPEKAATFQGLMVSGEGGWCSSMSPHHFTCTHIWHFPLLERFHLRAKQTLRREGGPNKHPPRSCREPGKHPDSHRGGDCSTMTAHHHSKSMLSTPLKQYGGKMSRPATPVRRWFQAWVSSICCEEKCKSFVQLPQSGVKLGLTEAAHMHLL